MKIQMRNNKLLTQIPGELENAVKFRCNKDCTLDGISNNLQGVGKNTNIGKYSLYKGNSLRGQPFRDENEDKPRDKVAEVLIKRNSCHNCGSKDHCSKKPSKGKEEKQFN
ncbi:hypothetical protein O181_125562 [Austropuccinia psidii MF-1]|uniref:Uncharacterized protein n=1 Tax=Austropuccinia psidii MF-1 TaxID=1389203 RepID=A0A9Q3Q7L0_9BASI|nr:hypothetical protein [Austropuccinia psidii MF-1]